MNESHQDRIASAAMVSLERHGVPAARSDMPGLYVAWGHPELTYNQLIAIACQRDPSFDPGRIA